MVRLPLRALAIRLELRGLRFAIQIGAGLVLLGLVGPPAAHALSDVPVDPAAFRFPLLATNGNAPLSPGVIVGFNPQPDPPGTPDPTLDLGNPALPAIQTPTVGGNAFRFLFALESPFVVGDVAPLSFVLATPPDPDHIAFEVRRGDALLFGVDAVASITGGGHLDPGSIVGFNPQPDPPGFQGFGVDFAFGALTVNGLRSVGVATLSFEMHDAAGDLYSFQSVPEPATLASVALGVALLARLRRQ